MDLLEWNSKLARQRFLDIAPSMGEPDWFIYKPNGGIGWEEDTLAKRGYIFSAVRIMDEDIRHNKPVMHCDCLYISIRVHIPLCYLREIMSLSESVMYDRLTQNLTVRCMSIGAAIATLNLALQTIYYNCTYCELQERLEKMIKSSMNPEGLAVQYKELYHFMKMVRKHFILKKKSDLMCDYSKFQVNPMPNEVEILKAIDLRQ